MMMCCPPPATVVLMGLEPNTTYEVRVAAVNGKGQGEFSHTESFQTLPIRKSLLYSSVITTPNPLPDPPIRKSLLYSSVITTPNTPFQTLPSVSLYSTPPS